MTPSLLAAESPYVTAAFGLFGSLIGGFIAGTVSIMVARHARQAAELAWIRDSRNEIYDRFLTNAQELLVACLACRKARAEGTETDENNEALELSYLKVTEAHAALQRLAGQAVINAARDLDYRTVELKRILDGDRSLGAQHFNRVAQLVRFARHDVIDAMRTELGAADSARPSTTYNPFQETDLRDEYAKSRPGPLLPAFDEAPRPE